MRETKQVKKCEKYDKPHAHLITSDNTYCQAVGQWLKDPTGVSVEDWKKQRKEAWKQKQQEEKDAK